MKRGDWVRLVNRAPIDAAALVMQLRLRPGMNPEEVWVPKVGVGDIGQVISDQYADGLFNVQFRHACIVCNDAMVEECSDDEATT